MAIDLSAASLIRSGSGLLYVALGLGLAVLSRRGAGDARVGALALHCVGFGASFITFNLGAHDPVLSPYFVLANAVAWAVSTAGILWFLAALRPAKPRALAYAISGLVLAGTAFLWAALYAPTFAVVQRVPPSGAVYYAASFGLNGLGVCAIVLAGVELAFAWAKRPAKEGRGMLLLAAALAVFPAFNFGGIPIAAVADAVPALVILSIFFAGLVVASATWLVVGARIGRSSSAIPLLLLGACLAGMIVTVLLGVEDRGAIGILRIGAVVALAFAVLKHDVFHLDLHATTVDRGTLAAGTLALLFIVAQIAQNFFSASFGLLTGGLVAGAFLFAAQPLQRAVEGMREGRAGAATNRGMPDIRRREGLYLNAARLAMRDRRLTRAEEAHLHALAEELGLGAKRAHELLVQAETEAGGT